MRKNKASVAVIIPAYGRYDLLLETINSVYKQRGNFLIKIIVVDDKYPEPAKKIIDKLFPQIQIIRNKKNLKSGPSRNQALKYIDTEYVAFLDSDDIWSNNFLLESIKRLKKTQFGATVALSKPLFAKELSTFFKFKVYLLSLMRDFFQLMFIIFCRGVVPPDGFYLCQLSHMLFKADIIRGLEFDSNYNFGGEDWKYVLEVMDRNKKIVIIPERLVEYRYHIRGSTLKDENRMNKWNSYKQLFGELDKRNMRGLMRLLFENYISIFQ